MTDFECFLAKRLNPVYRLHYAIWMQWWPIWRKFSSHEILRVWDKHSLITEGQVVLDYGCGAGSFSIPAARKVGKTGKVYALDCFPMQLAKVAQRSKKEGLTNIETVKSSEKTGLADGCVDVVWLCDVIHEVPEKRQVLEELHRVLKTGGTLAIYDSMKERILPYTNGLFALKKNDGKFLGFVKQSR